MMDRRFGSKAYRYFEFVVVQPVTLLMAIVVTAALAHLVVNIAHENAMQLLALSVAFLSLGIVYWLVRDQDRREQRD